MFGCTYYIYYIYFLRIMINIVCICVLRSHVQPAKNTPSIMNNTSSKLDGLLTCFGRLLHRSDNLHSFPAFDSSGFGTTLDIVLYILYIQIIYYIICIHPYITLINTRMICAISSHYLRFVGGSQLVLFAEGVLQR